MDKRIVSKTVLAMASFGQYGGYYYFLPSGDVHEMPHIHIKKGKGKSSGIAKFWLIDEKSTHPKKISLFDDGHFKPDEIRDVQREIEIRHFEFLMKYRKELTKTKNKNPDGTIVYDAELERYDSQVKAIYPDYNPEIKSKVTGKTVLPEISFLTPSLSKLYEWVQNEIHHLDRCDVWNPDRRKDMVFLEFEDNNELVYARIELYARNDDGKYGIVLEKIDASKEDEDGNLPDDAMLVQEIWWVKENEIPQIFRKINSVLDDMY